MAMEKTASYKQTSKITIKIASIDWCPQLCLDEPHPGYINEIVSKIYPSSHYLVTVDYFPWSRAIKAVREGAYDALLSPAKKEAPDLIYPQNAVGMQQMCFFVLKSSNWNFRDVNSLKNLNIGIARDTSIEELNSFMSNNRERFQFQTYLDRFVEQSAKKLMKGRFDAFVFTKQTTNYELHQLDLQSEIREAGCVSKANIYMAFTPDLKKRKRIMSLVDEFDAQMKKLLSNGVIEEILKKYKIN